MPPEFYKNYTQTLRKWQKSINLISPNTVDEIESRHILDSEQLAQYIPNYAKTGFDFGSGAGFPAFILAAARPEIEFHLFESDSRKCEFLKTISRENSIPVLIHLGRIEKILKNPDLPNPDFITARAFASLTDILKISEILWRSNPSLFFILPKGEKWQTEIDQALKEYNFEFEAKQSQTHNDARILLIENVSNK